MEVPLLAELHDDVDFALGNKGVVVLDDVGVVLLAQDVDFLQSIKTLLFG